MSRSRSASTEEVTLTTLEEGLRTGTVEAGPWSCNWRGTTSDGFSRFTRVIHEADPTTWEYGTRVFRTPTMTDAQFVEACIRAVRFAATEYGLRVVEPESRA